MRSFRTFAALAVAAFVLGLGPSVQATTVCLTTADNGTPWTKPADWNNAANRVDILSGGGDGGTTATGGIGGGGGGGYNFNTNITIAGATASFQVGIHGGVTNTTGATWFNGTSLTAASVSIRGANTATTTSGANGAATTQALPLANAIPGGAGGGSSSTHGGGGGGGAAGPSGTPATAGLGTTTAGGAGAPGDATLGGAAGTGATTSTLATAGGDGAEIATCTGSAVGPKGAGGGGGGGSLTATFTDGKNGGSFGAGGGGAANSGAAGLGRDGLIIITYTPLAATNGPRMGMLGGIVP